FAVPVLTLAGRLLNHFVRDEEFRLLPPNDNADPIAVAQIALIVGHQPAGCAVIREVPQHWRIEIAIRARSVSTETQDVVIPSILPLHVSARSIETATITDGSSVKSLPCIPSRNYFNHAAEFSPILRRVIGGQYAHRLHI